MQKAIRASGITAAASIVDVVENLARERAMTLFGCGATPTCSLMRAAQANTAAYLRPA